MQKSRIHSHIPGARVAQVSMGAADVGSYGALAQIGIHLQPGALANQARALMVGDAAEFTPAPGTLTPGSVGNLVQFLQHWLPGFVSVITAARKIDSIVGITTAGAPEDEEIVQGVLEPVGTARAYQDTSSLPFVSWNPTFERRTVVRFEQGMEVAWLENLRSARMRIDTASEKRTVAALSMDIERNRVGFYGYNDGDNRTYGLLNDPNIPAYVNLPAGAGGSTKWANKTFEEMTKDLRTSLQALRTQSKDVIDPNKTPITLALATDVADLLTTTTALGLSVREWLSKNYPNVRVESCPEFNGANGGENVFYVFADTVDDGGASSDDRATFVQVVPAKFLTLGVEQRAKAYVEAFANATAGVMCKRPYAVVRRSGC